MKKTKRAGNRKMTEKELEMFCLSVEDTLKKIHDRCGAKENKKKKKVKVSFQDKFTNLKEMDELDRMHLVG
mgnify:CR=1 FL=1